MIDTKQSHEQYVEPGMLILQQEKGTHMTEKREARMLRKPVESDACVIWPIRQSREGVRCAQSINDDEEDSLPGVTPEGHGAPGQNPRIQLWKADIENERGSAAASHPEEQDLINGITASALTLEEACQAWQGIVAESHRL